MDARGLEGLGQAHRRQDRGQAPRQPRLPRPRRAQQQDVWVITPASPSALSLYLAVMVAMIAVLRLVHHEIDGVQRSKSWGISVWLKTEFTSLFIAGYCESTSGFGSLNSGMLIVVKIVAFPGSG
jgi:hypothetical protein